MKAIVLNMTQVEFIYAITRGDEKIPSTPAGLNSLLIEFVKLYDYTSVEKEWLQHSQMCFLRTAQTRCDELGFAFRSAILNALTPRTYFKKLAGSTANRDVDAAKYVEQTLLEKKYIVKHGLQIRTTTEGARYIEHLKNFNSL
jgi:hypothetical protein